MARFLCTFVYQYVYLEYHVPSSQITRPPRPMRCLPAANDFQRQTTSMHPPLSAKDGNTRAIFFLRDSVFTLRGLGGHVAVEGQEYLINV